MSNDSPKQLRLPEKIAYLGITILVIGLIMYAIWGESELCDDQLNLHLGQASVSLPMLPSMKGGEHNPLMPHPDRKQPLNKAACRGEEPAVRTVVFSATTPQQKALYASQGYRFLPFLTLTLNSAPRDIDVANCQYWRSADHPNAAKLFGRDLSVTCSGVKCHGAVATTDVTIELDFSSKELPPANWQKAMAEVERFLKEVGVDPALPENQIKCN